LVQSLHPSTFSHIYIYLYPKLGADRSVKKTPTPISQNLVYHPWRDVNPKSFTPLHFLAKHYIPYNVQTNLSFSLNIIFHIMYKQTFLSKHYIPYNVQTNLSISLNIIFHIMYKQTSLSLFLSKHYIPYNVQTTLSFSLSLSIYIYLSLVLFFTNNTQYKTKTRQGKYIIYDMVYIHGGM